MRHIGLIGNQLGLCVRDGLVNWRRESDDGEVVRLLLLVTQHLRKETLEEVHDGQLSGHFGTTKTCAKTEYRYFWPRCTLLHKEM